MMNFKDLQIVAPSFEPHNASEAEILGAIVWLWMHSNTHQKAPLHTLNHLLLPAIKTGQYLLAIQNERPVAYVSWAFLDKAHETKYLKHASYLTSPEDWQNGDRGWFIDFIAPFGHTRQIYQLLTHQLFPKTEFRSLHHKGNDKGLRIVKWHGVAVHPLEARHWFEHNPVQWPNIEH